MGTVKSRLSRAHAALERILGPYVGRVPTAPPPKVSPDGEDEP
jgi:hypothetical protein